MNESSEHLPDDEALDRLLARARWPEPTAASQERLRQAFLRERWRRPITIGIRIAAAAVLLLAIGIWFMLPRQRSEDRVATTLPAVNPSRTTKIIARPPTLTERAILLSMPRPIRATSQPAIAKKSSQPPAATQLARLAREAKPGRPRQEILQALLLRQSSDSLPLYLTFVEDQQTAPDALAALDAAPDAVIPQLFARLDDPHISTRMAAARALGRIDGPLVTRQLAEMIQRNQNRREALAALITSPGRDALAYLSQARRDSSLHPTIQALESELKNSSQPGAGS